MRVFLIFLLLPLSSHADLNWDSWSYESPNGRFYFEYDGYGSYNMRTYGCNVASLGKLKQWYFYHGGVVGIYDNDGVEEYFAYSEEKCFGKTFTDKDKWQAYVEYNRLSPYLWTRWHSDDWRFYRRKFGEIAVLAPVAVFIPLGIYILIIIVFFRLADESVGKARRNYLLIASMLVLLPTLRLIMDFNPGSI